MKNYQAVFFDWDGTLMDSNAIKSDAYANLFAPYGKEVQQQVRLSDKNDGGIPRFDRLRSYFKKFLNKDVSETQLMELSRQMKTIVKGQMLKTPFIPGALETLHKLKRLNIPAFVVTGTPAGEITEIITLLNMQSLFTEIFGSPPQKSQILKNILEKYHYTPSQCLFVGDALADYQAASANAIPFLAVSDSENTISFPHGIIVKNKVDLG